MSSILKIAFDKIKLKFGNLISTEISKDFIGVQVKYMCTKDMKKSRWLILDDYRIIRFLKALFLPIRRKHRLLVLKFMKENRGDKMHDLK